MNEAANVTPASTTRSIATKVALVTGSGKRIGAFIAEYLHQHGYAVVLHYRHSGDAAKSLRDQFNQQRHNSAIALHADLADPSAWQQLAQQTVSWHKRLDLLVNNASSFYPTPIEQASPDQWQDLFASNAQAPFFLTQQLLPALKQQHGNIINIIDAMVDQATIHFIPYKMAKASLKTMTLSMAKALAPDIRVNGVAPGAILWPEHKPTSDKNKQQVIAQIPLQRMGEPSDIAQAVWFLAEQATYITGQILAVDGGRSLSN